MLPNFETLSVEDLQRVEPDWLAHHEEWRVIHDIREADVAKEKYLPKGVIEVQSEYAARVKMTKFVPESPQARGRLLGSLFSLEQDRKAAEDIESVKEWFGNVDRYGTDWSAWLETIAAPMHVDFLRFDPTRDAFAGQNISAIVVEFPLSAIGAGDQTLDVWATTARMGS